MTCNKRDSSVLYLLQWAIF